MSNCYDIDIKLNYFESGSSYKDMLENKKAWERQVKEHTNFFKTIDTKQKYIKKWREVYED